MGYNAPGDTTLHYCRQCGENTVKMHNAMCDDCKIACDGCGFGITTGFQIDGGTYCSLCRRRIENSE